jgi:hypothetical protein
MPPFTTLRFEIVVGCVTTPFVTRKNWPGCVPSATQSTNAETAVIGRLLTAVLKLSWNAQRRNVGDAGCPLKSIAECWPSRSKQSVTVMSAPNSSSAAVNPTPVYRTTVLRSVLALAVDWNASPLHVSVAPTDGPSLFVSPPYSSSGKYVNTTGSFCSPSVISVPLIANWTPNVTLTTTPAFNVRTAPLGTANDDVNTSASFNKLGVPSSTVPFIEPAPTRM